MSKIETSPLTIATQKAVQAAAPVTPWGNTGNPQSTAPAAPLPVAPGFDAAPVIPTIGGEHGKSQSGVPSNKKEEASIGNELKLQLEAAQSKLGRVREQKADCETAFKAAQEEVDFLTVEMEKLQPAQSVTNTIQEYHASQRKLLDERAEKLKSLRSLGVDFKELLRVKAPIDSAMGRKNGRGLSRPTNI